MGDKSLSRIAQQYLRQVAYAERELRTLRAKLRHFEDLGLGGGGVASGNASIRASTASSRVENAAIGIIDLTREIVAKIADFEALMRRAEKLIEKVPQENYRRILTLMYMCGMSFPGISDEMRYTDRNSVYRAHGWALVEFGKVMESSKGGKSDDSEYHNENV